MKIDIFIRTERLTKEEMQILRKDVMRAVRKIRHARKKARLEGPSCAIYQKR